MLFGRNRTDLSPSSGSRGYSRLKRWSMASAMATTGLFNVRSPVDPRNGAPPKAKTPPSLATSQ